MELFGIRARLRAFWGDVVKDARTIDDTIDGLGEMRGTLETLTRRMDDTHSWVMGLVQGLQSRLKKLETQDHPYEFRVDGEPGCARCGANTNAIHQIHKAECPQREDFVDGKPQARCTCVPAPTQPTVVVENKPAAQGTVRAVAQEIIGLVIKGDTLDQGVFAITERLMEFRRVELTVAREPAPVPPTVRAWAHKIIAEVPLDHHVICRPGGGPRDHTYACDGVCAQLVAFGPWWVAFTDANLKANQDVKPQAHGVPDIGHLVGLPGDDRGKRR